MTASVVVASVCLVLMLTSIKILLRFMSPGTDSRQVFLMTGPSRRVCLVCSQQQINVSLSLEDAPRWADTGTTWAPSCACHFR